MPLSAADVRRRGDRIRRRRTALVAGGAALAVAAVAVPILAVVSGNPESKDDDRDRVANDPGAALRADDLLREADTVYSPNEKSPWRTSETFAGDGQATYHPCQQEAFSALGATGSFTRTFTWGDTEPLAGTGLVEQIAAFDSPAAARAAYDTVAEWILDCEVSGADRTNVVPQGRTVAVPSGGDAVIYDLSWSLEPEAEDPFDESSYINETGIVVQGDRIAVVAVTINGQDYNFLDEEGGTPVNRMIPAAAERLLPGSGTTPQSSETPATPERTETGEPGSGVIPDDFPLTSRWPATTEAEDGDGIVGPARDLDALELTACGRTAPDTPRTDRLAARWENIEDYRTRQLTTYSSAEEAVAAVAAIRKVYTECPEGPTREDGYTPNWEVRDTTVGGESFAVLGWDELDGAASTFGDTTLVVRVGRSVLVVVHAGHAGNPQGQEEQAVDAITSESADVIAAMCAFAEAGC